MIESASLDTYVRVPGAVGPPRCLVAASAAWGQTRHDPAPGGYGEGGVEALMSVYRQNVTDRLRMARFFVQAI